MAILGYLAKHSRRSLLLAVEEPEAFLHPKAQEELRSDLGALAKRSDVTLLVTTHSPFMLDRSKATTITSLSKTTEGFTEIGEQISGDVSHAPVVSQLFGETITPTILEVVQPLRRRERGIVFVEGGTDKFYLEAAAKAAGREDLLDGLGIRHDEGAHKGAVQAILLRQMCGGDIPVVALFDYDEHGRSAGKLLKSKFGWRGNEVMTFRKWRRSEPSSVPVESEDMFPSEFLEGFVESCPVELLAEKMQYRDGTFHYGFTQEGKKEFMKYVLSELDATHCAQWVAILEHVRSQLGMFIAGPKD